ncbi:hypothetical protein NEOLI_003557 [Neolecta irregularis DAH-3]|uniref:Uncharacterized protein n=1 Tax=Neolecta irregularis (strain DAH-3) TaxID=1198029 RepID=A0A1U7LNF0_NEOID|nr:hypothetical protein NEOLI_003557 [Neolecta irregularis DAH-3]|eukprot:OLL24177.1 hypothetical protein NEOLI_003557 [Neolecta irregularis DAH-3]
MSCSDNIQPKSQEHSLHDISAFYAHKLCLQYSSLSSYIESSKSETNQALQGVAASLNSVLGLVDSQKLENASLIRDLQQKFDTDLNIIRGFVESVNDTGKTAEMKLKLIDAKFEAFENRETEYRKTLQELGTVSSEHTTCLQRIVMLSASTAKQQQTLLETMGSVQNGSSSALSYQHPPINKGCPLLLEHAVPLATQLVLNPRKRIKRTLLDGINISSRWLNNNEEANGWEMTLQAPLRDSEGPMSKKRTLIADVQDAENIVHC